MLGYAIQELLFMVLYIKIEVMTSYEVEIDNKIYQL